MEVTGPQKVIFLEVLEKLIKNNIFRSCDFIFNFSAFFSKMRQSILTLPVILSYIKFCVARWIDHWKTHSKTHLR